MTRPRLALRAALTFTDGDQLRLDAAADAAGFAVDTEARTITGLLVPYGKPARSKGQWWQFSQGSLTWSDVSRIKLIDRTHNGIDAIGVATALDDRPDGLYGTFKVGRGAAGDAALALAEDGVLDGLSIGVGLGGTYKRRGDINHAVSAPLMETTLTALPSFDDARVHQVAATATNQEGNTMTPEQRARLRELRQLTTFTAEQAEEFATLRELEADAGPDEAGDLTAAITGAIAAGFATLANPQGGPAGSPPAGGRVESVDEPAPYRFDGGEAEHDFSSDLFAGIRFGDTEALARVTDFVTDAFAPAFAPIPSTDVADLNPTRQRPDMYVDRLTQPTPLWNAINKGSLSDATPFTFPKFDSATGLVSDHTEGVEPTGGTFKAGKQTVEPAPVSGKVEIPREIIDQGGNPQVSALIWREMQRAYFEALEAKASALFASLTLSGALTRTLTAGATDGALVSEFEEFLADLQFVPGGFRFDHAAGHQSLYKRLAAAEDTTGRKLLPRLGATNASGTARARFASLDVSGVEVMPVHSLAGTDADGVRHSYLFASEDVHGWASPPRRLDFENKVAIIDLAIWGYQATACSRLDGVRRVSYNRAGA